MDSILKKLVGDRYYKESLSKWDICCTNVEWYGNRTCHPEKYFFLGEVR